MHITPGASFPGAAQSHHVQRQKTHVIRYSIVSQEFTVFLLLATSILARYYTMEQMCEDDHNSAK